MTFVWFVLWQIANNIDGHEPLGGAHASRSRS